MERLVGYERAILVDVIATSVDEPGTVRVAPLVEALSPGRPATSIRPTTVPPTTALDAGCSLGADQPSISVVTVEAERLDFAEELTPAVAAAVWPAADAALAALTIRRGEAWTVHHRRIRGAGRDRDSA